jgi:hypothetical protein
MYLVKQELNLPDFLSFFLEGHMSHLPSQLSFCSKLEIISFHSNTMKIHNTQKLLGEKNLGSDMQKHVVNH